MTFIYPRNCIDREQETCLQRLHHQATGGPHDSQTAAVKGQALRSDIRNYAKSSLGFSDQELSAAYDSRAILSIYKSMMYDRLMANKPEATKKVAQAPKMLKPGTSTPEARVSQEVKQMRGRLKQSGKAKDAASLFERFL